MSVTDLMRRICLALALVFGLTRPALAQVATMNAEPAGGLGAWTATENNGAINTVAGDATAALHGGFGYDLVHVAGDMYAYKDFSAQTNVYARWYFRFSGSVSGANNTDDVWHWDFDDGAGTDVARIVLYWISASSTFGYQAAVNIGGSRVVILDHYTASTFALNTTYCVEMHYVQSATVGGIEFWINGVSQGSDFTRNTGITAARFMNRISITTPTFTLYTDDFVVATTYNGPINATPKGLLLRGVGDAAMEAALLPAAMPVALGFIGWRVTRRRRRQ